MEQEKKANPDLTYAVSGWKPKFSLEEGLKKTVEWYMANAEELVRDTQSAFAERRGLKK